MRKHWEQNSHCEYFHNVTEAGTGARRRVQEERPRYVPTDWDDSLPYGGKVYLARRKLPDSWFCIFIQVRNHNNVMHPMTDLYSAIIHKEYSVNII